MKEKIEILLSVSAAALMMAAPVWAQNYKADETGTLREAPGKTYEYRLPGIPLIKDRFIGPEVSYITVNPGASAEEILGKFVYNTAGEEIASVDDIIINDSGQATMVIVSEGGFMGLGEKLAAFDYNLVTRRDPDGDVIMPLDKQALARAIEFSYEADPDDATTLVMPATSYRLSEILDAELIDPLGSEVAEVEDATLAEGLVEYIVFDLEDTTGIEDDMIAMPYDDLAKTETKGDLDFQMTSEQTRSLEEFVTTKVTSR